MLPRVSCQLHAWSARLLLRKYFDNLAWFIASAGSHQEISIEGSASMSNAMIRRSSSRRAGRERYTGITIGSSIDKPSPSFDKGRPTVASCQPRAPHKNSITHYWTMIVSARCPRNDSRVTCWAGARPGANPDA